jgi:hypothetical protein
VAFPSTALLFAAASAAAVLGGKIWGKGRRKGECRSCQQVRRVFRVLPGSNQGRLTCARRALEIGGAQREGEGRFCLGWDEMDADGWADSREQGSRDGL